LMAKLPDELFEIAVIVGWGAVVRHATHKAIKAVAPTLMRLGRLS